MQTAKKVPFFSLKSIPFKICLFVVTIECCLLIALGTYFLTTYNSNLDKNLHAKLAQPGILLSQKALYFDKGADHHLLSSLIQEEVIDCFVVNPDGIIMFSKEKARHGQPYHEYLFNEESELSLQNEQQLRLISYKHDLNSHIIATLSPLTVDDLLYGYLFMRVSANQVAAKKQQMLHIFILCSGLTIFLTMIITAGYIQQLVIQRLKKGTDILSRIEDENIFQQKLSTGKSDQIGLFIDQINIILAAITTHNTNLKKLYDAGERVAAVEDRQQLYITATDIVCNFFSVQQTDMNQLIEGALGSFYNQYPQIGTLTCNENSTRFFLSLPNPEKIDEFLWIKFLQEKSDTLDPSSNALYIDHLSRMFKKAIKRISIFERITLAEERYRELFSSAVEGIFRTSTTGRFEVVNPALAAMSGYDSPTEMITRITDTGQQYYADPKDSSKVFEQLLQEGKVVDRETFFRRKDGSVFPAAVSSRCIKNEQGGIIAFEGRIINIEERKLREKEEQNRKATEAVNRVQLQMVAKLEQNEHILQQSLKEKEVLLREIYHRTKNNMLVIISMLRLQVSRVTDTDAREIFKETENRIRAMSMVHEKLYQSDNLMEIDLAGYLVDMVKALVRSMTMQKRITVETSTEPILISIDHAVPLGLAVNEIVTNSIKHGFPDNNTGTIRLHLCLSPQDMIQLRINDSGVGIPASFQLEQNSSFGLQITRNLITKQLNGTIVMQANNGTETTICFTEPDRMQRIPVV